MMFSARFEHSNMTLSRVQVSLRLRNMIFWPNSDRFWLILCTLKKNIAIYIIYMNPVAERLLWGGGCPKPWMPFCQFWSDWPKIFFTWKLRHCRNAFFEYFLKKGFQKIIFFLSILIFSHPPICWYFCKWSHWTYLRVISSKISTNLRTKNQNARKKRKQSFSSIFF